jgi:hypothetical protein
MIEKGSNIVNEERIEQFSNFLFIGKVKGAFEGNPAIVNIAPTSLKYG